MSAARCAGVRASKVAQKADLPEVDDVVCGLAAGAEGWPATQLAWAGLASPGMPSAPPAPPAPSAPYCMGSLPRAFAESPNGGCELDPADVGASAADALATAAAAAAAEGGNIASA